MRMPRKRRGASEDELQLTAVLNVPLRPGRRVSASASASASGSPDSGDDVVGSVG